MSIRAAALLFLAAGLPAQQAPQQGDLAKEAALGSDMAERFRIQHGELDVDEAQAYLDRIVGELAAAAPGDGPCCATRMFTGGAGAPEWPEAFPGGRLFVPARSFLSAPDEQAFVERLAHAVAHARARDWAVPASKPELQAALFVAPCGQASEVPPGLRATYDAREDRAARVSVAMAGGVTLGTGDFERARAAIETRVGALPSAGPAAAPSLLR